MTADLEKLGVALQSEIDALDDAFDAQAEELSEVQVKAKTTDVHVPLVGLVWMPYKDSGDGRLEAAW